MTWCTQPIEAGLCDDLPAVRRVAIGVAIRAGVRLGPVGQMPAADRRRAYQVLRAVRRPAVADGMIREVRTRFGDREAAALLPACGSATVGVLLPDLEHLIPSTVLVKRHAHVLADRVETRLAAADERDRPGIWDEVGDAVLGCDPERALDLLERFAPAGRLPGELTAYGKLAARSPERVARLMTHPGRAAFVSKIGWWPKPLLRRLGTVPIELLVAFARLLPIVTQANRLFRAVAPERRAELYEAFRPAEGEMSEWVLQTLPVTTRLRVPPTTYLPWPEAEAAIAPRLRSSDDMKRAGAYVDLLAAAARSGDPIALRSVVDRLGGLRNEQDPVRRQVIYQINEVAHRFGAASVPMLTRVVTDALDAPDVSDTTVSWLADLVYTVFVRKGHDPAFIEFDLTYSFGDEARRMPDLQEMLRRAAGPDTPRPVAETAVRLWLDDPRTRGERVTEVLANDPAMVRLPIVWQAVSRHRTDLLEVAFAAGGIPERPLRPDRWVPRQRAAFVALQQAIADDIRVPLPERAEAIRTAARVSGAGEPMVRRYLDSPLREAALGALVWTDRPGEVLPELLAEAGTDRARTALYAAARSVRFVPSHQVQALLGSLGGKTTSRKSAAHLLAQYGPASAMEGLRDGYAAELPDVRVAIVSAARRRLDREASWTILEHAITGGDGVREAVMATPRAVAEFRRRRYASLVAASGQISCLAAWVPWLDDVTEPIIARLGGRLELFLLPGEAAELMGALDRVAPGTPALGHLLRTLATGADDLTRRRLRALGNGAVQARTAGDWLADAFRLLGAYPDHVGVAVVALAVLGRLTHLDEVADLCAGRPLLAAKAAATLADHGDAATKDLVGHLAERGDTAGGLFAVTLLRLPRVGTARWPELLPILHRHPDPDVRDEAYAIDPG